MKRAEIAALVAEAEQAAPSIEYANRLWLPSKSLNPRNPREAELWRRVNAEWKRHRAAVHTTPNQRRDHPDPKRYSAFWAWRDLWGAAAQEQATQNWKKRFRDDRNAPAWLKRPHFADEEAAADAWLERRASILRNDAAAFYESVILPLHKAIHTARRAGDAAAWSEAMTAAEGVMKRNPYPHQQTDYPTYDDLLALSQLLQDANDEQYSRDRQERDLERNHEIWTNPR